MSTFSLELKKFQYSAFASQETACFSAVVCVNGKAAFHARNDGQAGCDHYTPVTYTDAGRDAMKQGLAAIEAHAATLPPDTRHENITLTWDTELIIATAVQDLLDVREVKKLLNSLKTRLMTVKGGKLFQTKKVPPAFLTDAKLREYGLRDSTAVVVNLLSQPEQEALFLKVVRHQPLSA